MKFLLAIILTASLAFIAGLYVSPWWSFAVVAFLVALLLQQKAGKAFAAAFLGMFLLWAGLAWWIDMKNNGVLSKKIASVLPVGGNAMLLVLLTGIISGLIAGFAAMSGSYLRSSKSN